MKTFLLTIATLISVSTFAQKNFETEMSKSLTEWKQTNSSANFEQLSKDFPNEWLPKYYLAFSEVLSTFENKNAEENYKNLDEAKTIIEALQADNLMNPEILNLKALYLTAEIVQNPMQKGAENTPIIQQLYAKSLMLNPSNPRSVLGLAEFNINLANYSGADITQDCKNVKKSLALFDADQPKKNEPKWGKDRAESLLNNQCKTIL